MWSFDFQVRVVKFGGCYGQRQKGFALAQKVSFVCIFCKDLYYFAQKFYKLALRFTTVPTFLPIVCHFNIFTTYNCVSLFLTMLPV